MSGSVVEQHDLITLDSLWQTHLNHKCLLCSSSLTVPFVPLLQRVSHKLETIGLMGL